MKGAPEDLKALYLAVEDRVLSEEAREMFLSSDDEELIHVTVYTEAGNKAVNTKWVVSRRYLKSITLAQSSGNTK